MASANEIKAGDAFVEMKLRVNFADGMRQVQMELQGLTSQLKRFGTVGMAAYSTVATGLSAVVVPAVRLAQSMKDVADRTGMTVDSVSALAYAAQDAGADLETLEAVLLQIQEQAGRSNGGDAFALALRSVGLEVGKFRALNPEERLLALADGLQSVRDPAERAALGVQLMGEQARKLAPLMAGGAEGIRALMADAERLGLVLNAEQAQQLDDLGKSFDHLTASVINLTVPLATALAPSLEQLTNNLSEIVGELNKFLESNQEGIQLALEYGVQLAKFGTALAAGAIAVRAFLVVQAAWNAASKIAIGIHIALQALQGPAGWAKLAAGLAIAATASYATYAALDKLEEKLTSTSDAAKQANEEFRDAERRMPPRPPDRGTMSDAPVTEQEARDVFKAGLSGTEKMSQALDNLRLLWSKFGNAVNDPQVRAGFEAMFKDTIDQHTGIYSAIDQVTEEIERMTGAATAAEQEMRKMAEAGAPPKLLERYRQLIEYREALAAQQEADAEHQRHEDDRNTAADRIRERNMKPEERAQREIYEAFQLLVEGRIDLGTYTREWERIQKGLKDQQGTMQKRETLMATYSGVEAGRQVGYSLQQKLLDEAKQQTEHLSSIDSKVNSGKGRQFNP
ncbi:MAG: phage tail tape measure protein [Planctomycetaceae bacterium]|nr:phage tail tape measure protein [Planctomycetaceae bacterium]